MTEQDQIAGERAAVADAFVRGGRDVATSLYRMSMTLAHVEYGQDGRATSESLNAVADDLEAIAAALRGGA